MIVTVIVRKRYVQIVYSTLNLMTGSDFLL